MTTVTVVPYAESNETAIKTWVRQVVIGEGLCPFAADAVERTGYIETSGLLLEDTIEEVLTALLDPNSTNDNILLVILDGLDDFSEFWEICAALDENLNATSLNEHVQLAHFHPHYRFEGVPVDDLANWSNRAPLPILHFLRIDAVEAAIQSHGSPSSIPARNIKHLRAMKQSELKALFPWSTSL